MRESLRTRIKICCISGIEEAALAVRYGAAALGLVSAMPSGPGILGEEKIAEIRREIPPGVASFLLTCRRDAAGIIEQLRVMGCNTVQLCDCVGDDVYARLREAIPSLSIVQVIHVAGHESLDEARQAAEQVDAVLLDSGRPHASVRELGGTGRVHDWEISRRIRDVLGVPVFLAGGLDAENVRRAIDQVRPFGVDVCSGVRSGGALDQRKLAAFCAAVDR